MDPHRIYTSVCAVVVCLLGATRLSSGDNCKCPAIPPKDFTVQKDGCFQINSTFRYQCTTGYTRKPGTSGLIKCQEKNGVLQWTKSLFKCITDPNYQPPPTTTTGPSSTLQSVRTSTSEPSVSPNTERRALGPSSTLQSVRASTLQSVRASTLQSVRASTLQSVRASTLQSVRASTLQSVRASTLQSVRTSTSEPSASANTERRALGGERRTVCISLIGVILFFMVCGIIFFLHRQRNKPFPPRDPEELEAMKC
ncbi:uncharacterized protein LOC114149248 isoform X3 [Xiphophorus couchianus]|uniref:uncharacterized protein LOC114149248 isoform X3 n=1 Tax=Xiphophorus couchianus TaxID=32473 RepID=UPI001016DDAD|nr:uncharacterized protein LOC114149248 isoform X3 [Xiphophorus couchianus]